MKKVKIFSEGTYSKQQINTFISDHPDIRVVDVFEHQLHELYISRFPSEKNNSKKKHTFFNKYKPFETKGDWIYFPWKNQFIHTVSEKEYFFLRTFRNRNLILEEEQKILYQSSIAIFGLSIGSHIVENLVRQGMTKHLTLADFDTIETTNLNRIRASITDLYSPKIEKITKNLLEIDPYLKIFMVEAGANKNNLESILTREPSLNLLIDAIDDFEMKILLRIEAKKRRIPVLMLTNVDNAMVFDVERYDIDPNQDIFHGLLGGLPEKILREPIEKQNEYAIRIVGKEIISERAMRSLSEIGKTLGGRPQLNGTISASAGIATYVVKNILLHDSPHIQGRFLLELDAIFV